MNNTQSDSPISQKIAAAKDIYILLPKHANQDTIAAGLGLFHGLNATSANVTLATPAKVDTQLNLPGIDQIQHKIGNRNLVISLKVQSRESIDKVSYNLDEETNIFNLVIQPRKNFQPLKTSDIEYSYAGVQADLFILINANRFEDFGVFYQAEQQVFTQTESIAINTRKSGTFATIHQAYDQASSISEAMLKFMQDSKLAISKDTATCLLSGIDHTTNHLQNPQLKPEVFESFATLMRAGGQRSPASQSLPDVASPHNNPTPNTNIPQDWLQPKVYSGTAAQATTK